MLKDVLKDTKYGYTSNSEKEFIIKIDTEFERLGYTSGGATSHGFCWGKDMIIYQKKGVKSNKSYARIYLRDDGAILRMYFSKVDKQSDFIKNSKPHIKEVFTGDFGNCKHCKNENDEGFCKFQKIYSIDGMNIQKCNGNTFYFFKPKIELITDYIEVFSTFYPPKRRK